jgi:hypothetical protein
MRKIATLTTHHRLKRVMICESEDGCDVFLYDRIDDGPGIANCLEGSISDAEMKCAEYFGINESDWTEIPDPHEGCQRDWIQPVRFVGKVCGSSRALTFERLESGLWDAFNLDE